MLAFGAASRIITTRARPHVQTRPKFFADKLSLKENLQCADKPFYLLLCYSFLS